VKEEFPGYFPISETASKAAWKDGIFSFDASVLLDLYRYSDETRQELSKLLKFLGDRLWITRHATQEFLDMRLSVIANQAKKYQESVASLDAVEASYKSSRGHPFLTKSLLADAEALFRKLRAYFNGKKSHLEQLSSKDPIQEEIAALLAGRVGPGFSPEKLREVFADGDKRYKSKIPPGYEDSKKPEGDNRFGDLVIWMELLEKAEHEKKAVTFVTADEKEDWWRISQGKTIGPRPELAAELKKRAGVELQMFSPDRFMELAAEKLLQDVKPAAIEEVKQVSRGEIPPSVLQGLRRLDALESSPNFGLQMYQEALNQYRLDALQKTVSPPPDFLQSILDNQARLDALQKQTAPPPAFLQSILDNQARLDALQKQTASPPAFLQSILDNQARLDALQKQTAPPPAFLQSILDSQARLDALQKQTAPPPAFLQSILDNQARLDALQKQTASPSAFLQSILDNQARLDALQHPPDSSST
jgi:hypothetical protein